jgi:hypothetical protein
MFVYESAERQINQLRVLLYILAELDSVLETSCEPIIMAGTSVNIVRTVKMPRPVISTNSIGLSSIMDRESTNDMVPLFLVTIEPVFDFVLVHLFLVTIEPVFDFVLVHVPVQSQKLVQTLPKTDVPVQSQKLVQTLPKNNVPVQSQKLVQTLPKTDVPIFQ